MSGSMLIIKNWAQFQHYKDRNPPWIKLHTDTFQRRDFNRLPDASKLLAICIWTLAARETTCSKGEIPEDLEWIKSQCGLGNMINNTALQVLIDKGFIERDSNALAGCLQSACLEKSRGEAEERRGEDNSCAKNSNGKSKKPNLAEIAERVRADWNDAVDRRPGWRKCTKPPAGETGKLLEARCKEPEWLAEYPAAIERMIKLDWMTSAKFSTLLRPDTVRKVMDEWEPGSRGPNQIGIINSDDDEAPF
jgi:hypothetical protein